MKETFSKYSFPQLHKLISSEIATSGLKAGAGFHQALDRYTKHYKIQGTQAAVAKAYLAKTAIDIVKIDEGIFSGGARPKSVSPSHLQSAAYLYHPPPQDMTDKCKQALEPILQLEKERTLGSIGRLTPGFSKCLDEIKATKARGKD